MPLFYIAHYEGFVGYKRRTKNVREARSFTSFEEADEYAKSIPLTIYAILQTPEREITLTQTLRQRHGHWGEHPDYPASDWRYDVVNGFTRYGYWNWVESCIKQEDKDNAND